MKISQGDYLVVRISNRPSLLKCINAEGPDYVGMLERNRDKGDKDARVEFKFSEVLSNLGKRPKIGSVHGLKIEPLVLRLDSASKMWAEIRVYQFWDKKQQENFMIELDDTTKKLRPYGLGSLRCELEVRNPHGKYAGYYKYRPKAETDILCIKPEENFEGFQYILSHEAAHGAWSRQLTAKARIRWIQLYHEYVTLQEVMQEELTVILEEIVAATSIGDYLKDADEISVGVVKDALRHIQRVHGLGRHHLELSLNNNEDISAYWPTALELSSKEECLTPYATKSPEELFAEAFAFHICGRKIPKKIQALLDNTLSRLKKA